MWILNKFKKKEVKMKKKTIEMPKEEVNTKEDDPEVSTIVGCELIGDKQARYIINSNKLFNIGECTIQQ